ncbi:glutamate--tRNA ligase [Candidatus Woesearchaeota archaeon]|nr:glutamate--tRNA ligase [Candidatus Woesearchaeota archaeon]
MDMQKVILAAAVQNACKFAGKANPNAVLGILLAQHPELRAKAKELMPAINALVAEVNQKTSEEQVLLLDSLGGTSQPKKQERDMYAFLKITEGEKIVSAFPPEPSKYPHIGHAKAILLNYNLAKKYHGMFVLRFEDTNPALAKEEFYRIHLENYQWIGVQWDKLDYASDYLDQFYAYAEQLIKSGNAYVCSCTSEVIKANRFKGIPCTCRITSVKKNQTAWKAMRKQDEGTAILRLKIKVDHQNTTMRDPTIMRIVTAPHPRVKTRYRVWPTYDFVNAIMDGIEGITHRLRSKEFEMRNPLQRHIQKLLNLPETTVVEFARFNLEGVESSGRIIREKINAGELIGWDDPRLTTLVALQRRGFLPKAIQQFVLKTGITKAEATLTWDDLIMHNKRLLDAQCNRYFMIEDPVKVTIEGTPTKQVELKLHPEDPERGKRRFTLSQEFYLEKQDFKQLEDGKLYRLMDCLNFVKKGKSLYFDSFEVAVYKAKGTKIMHWLPVQDTLIPLEVMMPDTTRKKGLAEATIKDLPEKTILQFERKFFAILDKKQKNKHVFWYTHA